MQTQSGDLSDQEEEQPSGQRGTDVVGQERQQQSPAKAADYLANERTLLAWVRTSIALIGLGFVVARFSLFLRQLAVQNHQANQGLLSGHCSSIIGIVIVGLAALLLGLSYLRYRAAAQALDHGSYHDSRGLAVGAVTIVVLVALALVVYLAITS